MFAKCQNCRRSVLGSGVRDKLGIFCSAACRDNVAHPRFCDACIDASTPIPTGSNLTVNGIGSTFHGSSNRCNICGSEVRTQCFCFLSIPLVPLGKFRVKYVARNQYLSRMLRKPSECKEIAESLKRRVGFGPAHNVWIQMVKPPLLLTHSATKSVSSCAPTAKWPLL